MANSTKWVSVAAIFAFCAIGLVGARPARAEGGDIEVNFTTKAPDPNNPKTKGEAPTIEATVIGAPNLTADKFVLVDKSSKPALEVKASLHRPFVKGNETLAIAFVMLGWEQWIGNESTRDENDPTRVKGVLKPLQVAFDKLNFKDAGPPGSVATLITYGDSAAIRMPMSPLANMSGAAFGNEQDYKDTKSFELVRGISLAMTELKKVQNPQKVLIVITDGVDTNIETAKGQLSQLKKEAQAEHIQTFGVVYKCADTTSDVNVLLHMIQSTMTVSTVENIAEVVSKILGDMKNRQYLTFPGYNKETKLGPKWDGKQHELVIKIEKDESEPELVPLVPIWNPPTESSFPWLILIIVFAVVLILIIVAVKVFSKKPEPLPVPMPMAMAPAPEAPPKPLGPAKTVMIGQGGDEGGFPVVGWLVPLNGQNAYQTFRLRGGGTKIGTAPPADIVVNDGFMSTEHCQIHCSPTGFSLVDGGSTNGCYVNDKRIAQKHDLVDNDMVTLGKTNFKFKSIV